jgi:hypothetical protein
VEITGYVNANSALEASCWSANFGYPIGTVGWSVRVDSQTDLAAGQAQLAGDDGYHQLVEAAEGWVTVPGQDLLRRFVYGSPGEPPPIGSIAQITTATAVVDRLEDAIGWSVEIAQHVEGVTGSPVAVLSDTFGTMGGMAWIGVQPDLAGAEAGSAKMMADPTYLGRMTATAGLFLPGSGHVAQLTRFA